MFSVPISTLRLDQFVGVFAQGVVQAQVALDQNLIATSREVTDPQKGLVVQKPNGDVRHYSMLEMGFMPSAFHITQADLDLKVGFSASLDVTKTKATQKKKRSLKQILKGNLSAQSIDAAYSSRYQFRMEGASQIQASLVSRPEPKAMIERLKQQIQGRSSYETAQSRAENE